ncbi:hypothetical protein GQ600_20631 [Phytophthora cactorum]|nr:hypothetical protein GQ600_20631 [Phytophthora cactorum]
MKSLATTRKTKLGDLALEKTISVETQEFGNLAKEPIVYQGSGASEEQSSDYEESRECPTMMKRLESLKNHPKLVESLQKAPKEQNHQKSAFIPTCPGTNPLLRRQKVNRSPRRLFVFFRPITSFCPTGRRASQREWERDLRH